MADNFEQFEELGFRVESYTILGAMKGYYLRKDLSSGEYITVTGLHEEYRGEPSYQLPDKDGPFYVQKKNQKNVEIVCLIVHDPNAFEMLTRIVEMLS